jgi:hypothetical protein
MADIAVVLLDQRPVTFQPRRIFGSGRWFGRRLFRVEISNRSEIFVAEFLGHFVHRLGDAKFFAEHEQLDHRVGGRLPAPRRHILDFRLPLGAVTGKARRQFLVEIGSEGGKHAGQECRKNCPRLARARHHSPPNGAC